MGVIAAHSAHFAGRAATRRAMSKPAAVTSSPFAQNHLMPAFGLDRRGEAEVIKPPNKFKPPARLDQTKKLLREKDLRRDPSFNSHVFAVIFDGESQPFVVGLCDRVEKLGTIAGAHPHAAFAPGPASLPRLQEKSWKIRNQTKLSNR